MVHSHGRSIRNLMGGKLGGIIVRALVESKVDLSDPSKVEIEIDFKDSAGKKPYAIKGIERQVNFYFNVFYEGKKVASSVVDLSQNAPEIVLLDTKGAKEVAFHEAGHAVANKEKITGDGVDFITIRGGSDGSIKYYGYARYSPLSSARNRNIDREKVVEMMARSWAGRLAQEKAGYPGNSGWAQDLAQIRKLGTMYLKELGLEDSMIGIPAEGDGKLILTVSQDRRLEKKLNELVFEARDLAQKRLEDQWPLVRSIAAELLLRGDIRRERFLDLQGKFLCHQFYGGKSK